MYVHVKGKIVTGSYFLGPHQKKKQPFISAETQTSDHFDGKIRAGFK